VSGAFRPSSPHSAAVFPHSNGSTHYPAPVAGLPSPSSALESLAFVFGSARSFLALLGRIRRRNRLRLLSLLFCYALSWLASAPGLRVRGLPSGNQPCRWCWGVLGDSSPAWREHRGAPWKKRPRTPAPAGPLATAARDTSFCPGPDFSVPLHGALVVSGASLPPSRPCQCADGLVSFSLSFRCIQYEAGLVRRD